ncbi:tetratricopeptide repeat protein [Escherichia coli]|uniref:tetratricopeptide repeat protein n=1 Tax=Escherichia coli TaxID=562 RepID=UPI001FCE3C9F|nr:tetratricopeptide repeat protein [Escherichia coli]
MIHFINENINLISALGVFCTAISLIIVIVKIKKKKEKKSPKNHSAITNNIVASGENTINNINIDQSKKKEYHIHEIKEVDAFYSDIITNLSHSSDHNKIELSKALDDKNEIRATELLTIIIQEANAKQAIHENIITEHSNYLIQYQDTISLTYMDIATIASMLKLDIAEDYFKKALDLHENNHLVLHAYSLHFNVKGEYHKAIELAHKLLTSNELSKKDLQYTYGNLGIFYKNISDWHNAELYQKKSLSIAIELGDKIGQIKANNNIAVLLNNKENYNEAFNILLKMLSCLDTEIDKEDDIKEKNGLRTLKSNLLTNIVISLRRLAVHSKTESVKMDKLNKALRYINEAIEISEMLEDDVNIITNLGNASNVYRQMNQFEKCEKFLEKALDKSVKYKNRKLIALCKYNLAVLYTEMGKLDLADNLCKEALTLKSTLSDRIIADIYFTLAIIANKKNSNDFENYYTHALSLYEKLNLDKSISNIKKLKYHRQDCRNEK